MLEIFGSRFEMFEWIRESLGLVSFIGDSGENIFFGDCFEIFWNRLEIFECGVKFVGQVSFIKDSGGDIFWRLYSYRSRRHRGSGRPGFRHSSAAYELEEARRIAA